MKFIKGLAWAVAIVLIISAVILEAIGIAIQVFAMWLIELAKKLTNERKQKVS